MLRPGDPYPGFVVEPSRCWQVVCTRAGSDHRARLTRLCKFGRRIG